MFGGGSNSTSAKSDTPQATDSIAKSDTTPTGPKPLPHPPMALVNFQTMLPAARSAVEMAALPVVRALITVQPRRSVGVVVWEARRAIS